MDLFRHAARGIVTSVHGGDFPSVGAADSLDWLDASIANRYELTTEPRLGPGPTDANDGRVFNRIIRWCENHIEYGADLRQVDRFVVECCLGGAKGMAPRRQGRLR